MTHKKQCTKCDYSVSREMPRTAERHLATHILREHVVQGQAALEILVRDLIDLCYVAERQQTGRLPSVLTRELRATLAKVLA